MLGILRTCRTLMTRENYIFAKLDIVDKQSVTDLFRKYPSTELSILLPNHMLTVLLPDPDEFVYTNIVGTVNLLNAARDIWQNAI